MTISLKVLKILLKSQLLSIIFAIISRFHINLLLSHTNLLTNSIALIFSFILFILFCIIINILFLNRNLINVILIAISYVIYWYLFSSKILLFYSHNNPNDYGFGILGISIELFVGLFQYVIVIISSVVAVSIHQTKNALKNND
ncbi:hypothetical protein [Clostridium tyrobutyricum]|jgi:hypothetical protein|uniref:hypothetical protein n=1 Tax=Clostridium tyrobutyricum TaxID=1519 RepID=UPI002432DA8B|nr:hypothetical protein [Clostridium tyrobutyricum]MCH4200919.1 hypothetical protein [Clostridium tyrobutyricum]MCI1651263.1 hypothetical protein [Clostridium tyrobutyricum]